MPACRMDNSMAALRSYGSTYQVEARYLNPVPESCWNLTANPRAWVRLCQGKQPAVGTEGTMNSESDLRSIRGDALGTIRILITYQEFTYARHL